MAERRRLHPYRPHPGDPEAPPTFSVTFTETGSYNYYCEIHPFMTATVNVVDEGEEVDTQEELDAEAAAAYETHIASIKAVAAAAAAEGGSVTRRDDGTNLYEVLVGANDEAGNDAMLYFPGEIDIEVGDSINWVLYSPLAPHTVTFNAELLEPGARSPSRPRRRMRSSPARASGTAA